MVSIIIPVYNVRDYIVKCLESVAEQTYNGPMECIIVDDCGRDDSVQLAKDFIDSYVGGIKFRIVHHSHNRGLSAARNTGIYESKGEWLYFLDSDDWIIPNCIQLMMEQVSEHPDVEMVCAGANVTAEGYEWLDYEKKLLPPYSNDSEFLQRSMLKRFDIGMTAWNKLISKPFVVHNGLYFEEGYIYEDEIWNFLISSVITSACFLKLNTYFYNIRPLSIKAQENEDSRWPMLFKIWKKMLFSVHGRRQATQTMGICKFVVDETRYGFPLEKNKELFRLFVIMAWKCHSNKCILYLFQGALALFSCKKYNNSRIVEKIAL